jgi:PGF-pre-PGF domain-containing protein
MSYIVAKKKMKLPLLIIISLAILIIPIQPVLADPLITIDEFNSPTNIDFQIVSGTMSSGSKVVILFRNEVVNEMTSTDTIWSANVSGMEEGDNLITAIAADSEGTTNSTTAIIVLDKTPPEIEINNVNSPTNNNSQIINGNMEIGAVVAVSCPTAVIGSVSNNTDTTWTVDITDMTEGNNIITVTATDEVGNIRTRNTTIILDNTPPDITINVTSPTKDNYQLVSGTMEPGSTIIAYSPNATVGTAEYPDNITWEVLFSGLQEGNNEIIINATDMAGNTASDSKIIVLDTVKPVIGIDDVPSHINTDHLIISGFVEDGAGVMVNCSTCRNTTINPKIDNMHWSADITNMIDGDNVITATAIDQAGNTNSTDVVIFSDTTLPDITSPFDKRIKIDEKNRYITWVITETYPGYYWIKESGKSVIEPSQYQSGNEIKCPVNTSTLGDRTYIIYANDTAGNEFSDEMIITIQETAPLTIESPADGSTVNSGDIEVIGYVEGINSKPEIIITVNTSNFSENVDPVLNDEFTGTYSKSVPLIEGTNIITVTAIYAKGNSESLSVTVTRADDEITNPARSGSSGSGGGSGGGTSSEDYNNILFSETVREFVSKDKDVSYHFDSQKNIVRSINFTPLKTKGNTPTKIEILKDTSSLVNYAPLDKVYMNLNIWIGSFGYATPQNIANATINFKVEKSWVNENKISTSTIKLNRYNKSEWDPLITNQIDHDADYLYFESETHAFSPFVVTGKEEYSGEAGEEGMTITPDVTEDEMHDNISDDNISANNISSDKENSNPTGLIIIIICLLSLVVIIFIIRKKKMI